MTPRELTRHLTLMHSTAGFVFSLFLLSYLNDKKRDSKQFDVIEFSDG
ncbi:hypothetical protein ECEC1845_4366 [Escherichia coli EC1845]|nr:hypothetical protein ECH7EC4113_2548 [Escherichia coli O157:H7 str. EC4113]EFW56420.1 hypothetical protein SGB_01373 [Shigella boydii ATCC 9905]EGW68740.1 hypothetical protein ECSTECB2F1_3537 [Escherichia coli O91:H21 str. B2F1]EHV22097.1 hypothetical protein ECDEC5A_3970 [Escherichia coli DEC5A]EHV36235.1 hypothetical protein ECDEC5D_4117 [Escherichia coli DEC5D]EHV93292.1 hypothetical protein ECDEC7B_3520 [Escherichia coli DEC7B]EHV98673.1 hypothetical protein ECDEC7E_3681 [Escherichia c